MESIFERDFYPTPEHVIGRMLQGHEVGGKIIFEPSAGSGNIVDYLKANYAKEVIACEMNSKLRSIVASKCDVIADDFLTVTSDMVSHIDMIVMNPPFSNARKHILHAYEIAPDGCEIISLCNATDMSDNKYHATTDHLKLHELVSNNGYSEVFGNVFSDAERRTNADIACIHLYKPKSGESEFEDYMFSTIDEQDHGRTEGLIEYNLVRDVVNRYCEAVKMFDTVIGMSNEINDLTSIFRGSYDRDCMFGCFDKKSGDKITRERYKKEMQKLAWKFIIDKMNMKRFATSKVYDQINAFVERQQHIPFTMKNVYQMIYMIVATQGNRMETALVEAFDHICSFSAENSTAGETWKTNANYMVNRNLLCLIFLVMGDTACMSLTSTLTYGGATVRIKFMMCVSHLSTYLAKKKSKECSSLYAGTTLNGASGTNTEVSSDSKPSRKARCILSSWMRSFGPCLTNE